MLNFIKKSISEFENLDCFGYRVELYFQKNNLIKSKFGAAFTLMLLIFFFYFLVQNFQTWQNAGSLKTIISTQSYSTQELFKIGENWNYTFTYENYYPYFILRALYPNGSYLDYSKLDRYFNQYFYYYDNNSQIHYPETEPCRMDRIDEFLQLPQEAISADFNKTSNAAVCIKDSFFMGLFLDVSYGVIRKTSLSYAIAICQNSTENNYSCASEQEIQDIMNNMYVLIYVPRSVFDFHNGKNSRKRTYDVQSFYLDFRLFKSYVGYISPIFMKTDNGLLDENYELDSIDFNCEKQGYEMKIREAPNPFLFSYGFQFGFSQTVYHRQNLKLKDIMANVGGIMNILILIGKLVCLTYNSKIFRQKIFNSMNLQYGRREKKKISIKSFDSIKLAETCQFSLFTIIFPCLQTKISNEFFLKAMNHLYDFLDIQNIVKRMHLLDILFFSKTMGFTPTKSTIQQERSQFGLKSNFKLKQIPELISLDMMGMSEICNRINTGNTRKAVIRSKKKICFETKNVKKLDGNF